MSGHDMHPRMNAWARQNQIRWAVRGGKRTLEQCWVNLGTGEEMWEPVEEVLVEEEEGGER